mgnify:CR=1 FL=1
MSEEMEKTPVVRAESAPVVKEAQLPAEKKAAEVPAVVRAKEEAHVDSPEADVEIHIIDNRDEEAESLIRWAAGRAGVIVAAPVLGTVALVANEVYMIAKVAKVYDVEVNQTAILSFIGSLGGTVIGTTLATLIPISIMQIPIGVTVTYGVGKAAQRWIKDGMPDDTRPYRAVFEEEKAAAASEEKELEDNPKKDEPLGDEKKDFTKELKKNWEEVYPEKAHAKMNELADQLSESVTVLGDKFLSALKKVGVTDEQIEKAYTALGASEIAQETAEKAAKDLQAIARIKSREFKKDAAKKAEVMKAQAKDQMEVLQQKREEMKRQSEVQSQQMKLKSEKLKAQARVQMQEAKIQANKLKVQAEEFRKQAEEQAETAKASAQEFSEKVKTQAAEYKEAAQAKAAEAKESFKQTASEYKAKIEERAAQKQAEAKKEGNPGENPGTSEEAPKADPPADPKE